MPRRLAGRTIGRGDHPRQLLLVRAPRPLKEYGPVFVLSEPAYETVVRDALPLPKGGPDDYFGDRFVLRAYSHGGDILDGELVWSVEAMTNSVAGSRMHRGEITQAHRLRASV